MKPTSSSTLIIGIVAIAGACLGPASAVADGPAEWAAVSLPELATTRALGVSDPETAITATISGGSITIDGLEASNLIDGGAFAGAAGLVNVLQNNGSGAVVSNTMNVVVTVYPGPAP